MTGYEVAGQYHRRVGGCLLLFNPNRSTKNLSISEVRAVGRFLIGKVRVVKEKYDLLSVSYNVPMKDYYKKAYWYLSLLKKEFPHGYITWEDDRLRFYFDKDDK